MESPPFNRSSGDPSESGAREHVAVTMPRISRRTLLAGSAGALAVAAGWQGLGSNVRTGSAQQATPTAGSGQEFAPPAFSDEEVDSVVLALAAAGIAVYDQPFSPFPIIPVGAYGPLSLLKSQVKAMVLEASNRAGSLGAELDALVIQTGAADAEANAETVNVPPSALLAAYVAATESPGAELARRFMPLPDVQDSANVVFPGLVLSVFAGELARESAVAVGMPAVEMATIGVGGVRAYAAQTGVCSTIQSFIDRTLNALFNALHVDLGSSTPGQILSGILNFLLGAAKAAIREAIKQLTAPVLDAIKTIAGVIGTASMIVSAIRPWSLRMTPNPIATRLAVGPEAPIPGSVQCLVDLGGLDEWPSDIADCAAQSGTPLPPLKPAGAACTWKIEHSRFPFPLIAPTQQPAALDQNGAVTLDYVTLSEDEKTAKGTPIDGWVRVSLTIARPELDNLRQTLTNLVFAQLPGIVSQFIRPILGPVVDGLLVKLQSLTDSKGSATFGVLYHAPKEDDPTPEPEPDQGEPATINVTFSPEIETPFPAIITLDAATCDGTTWDGNMRLVFQVDTAVVKLDLDQTRPVSWSFEGGDSTTAKAGPFQSRVIYKVGNGSDNYTVQISLTVERSRGEGDATTALSFTMDATVAVAGIRETNSITGSSNLGIPIAVTPGNPDC